MTYARQSLICLQATPYYHVVARCVRRAWLWGYDEYTGKDYSHRKARVLERPRDLSSVFAIDVCAYAVVPFPRPHSPGSTQTIVCIPPSMTLATAGDGLAGEQIRPSAGKKNSRV